MARCPLRSLAFEWLGVHASLSGLLCFAGFFSRVLGLRRFLNVQPDGIFRRGSEIDALIISRHNRTAIRPLCRLRTMQPKDDSSTYPAYDRLLGRWTSHVLPRAGRPDGDRLRPSFLLREGEAYRPRQSDAKSSTLIWGSVLAPRVFQDARRLSRCRCACPWTSVGIFADSDNACISSSGAGSMIWIQWLAYFCYVLRLGTVDFASPARFFFSIPEQMLSTNFMEVLRVWSALS